MKFTSRIDCHRYFSKENWLLQLKNIITSPKELLHILKLESDKTLLSSCKEKCAFPLRVPYEFVSRIEKGNPNDPLLKQIITMKDEFIFSSCFSKDPLKERSSVVVPGLLHKYRNRVLLIIKNHCAINCRYCFRRYFPYKNNKGNKKNWKLAINYISMHSELDEIIFSGGDPLIAKDDVIDWLFNHLENIQHIKRLRIHSRIPSIIPSRITEKLIYLFSQSKKQIILVNHINHPNEISKMFYIAMSRLRQINVTLLNQSVLLRGVNDDPKTLAKLSNILFDSGVMPYYLHILDKVQGTTHFLVSEEESRNIMKELLKLVSGYMVPKLMKEIPNQPSKIPVDLKL